MKIYQYISLGRPRALARMIARIIGTGACVILDLEDSIQNVIQPDSTAELKRVARDTLLQLVTSNKEIFKSGRIGLRINSLDSPYYQYDIALLRELTDSVRWNCIRVPKVNTADDFIRYATDIDNNILQKTPVEPILESSQAIEGVESIFQQNPNRPDSISFGYADYLLDAGIWPFWKLDSCKMWDFVGDLVKTVEGFGCSYIHPPVFTNAHVMDLQVAKVSLKKLCKLPFTFSTISGEHTRLLQSDYNGPDPIYSTHQTTEEENLTYAKNIVCTVERFNNGQQGFTINPVSGSFISPHEYEAARNFIAIRESGKMGQNRE